MTYSFKPSATKVTTSTPSGSALPHQRSQETISFLCLAIVWILFIGLNLRHLFDPFRDYGKPLAGEPYYAIRALNYLRHGYFSHWLGVCDNLNPHAVALKFKFTEMPGYFIASSLAFRVFGTSSTTFRFVELSYGLGLFIFFSLGVRKVFGSPGSVLASLILLLLPVNIFLLFISWAFLFPMLGIFCYSIWIEERCRTSHRVMIVAVVLGCLHHVAGFFLAPAMLVHAVLTRTLKKNAAAIAGVFSASAFVGVAYLVQILLLRQNFEAVQTKAVAESIFNYGYIRDFFALNLGKLSRNVNELLTIPLLLISALWLVRKVIFRKHLSAGDHCILLLLMFPALFYLVFLGMVGSHLHFLTMFGPFFALAVARAGLGIRPKMFRFIFIPILIVYLAFVTYGIQKKYDDMFWAPGNERGHSLALILREGTEETQSIAGTPYFGYSYEALSPAFFFYLDRDYFEGITTLRQFQQLTSAQQIRFFLFPAAVEPSGDAAMLGEYLSRRYPYFIDPGRNDLLIYDLVAGVRP